MFGNLLFSNNFALFLIYLLIVIKIIQERRTAARRSKQVVPQELANDEIQQQGVGDEGLLIFMK